MTSLFKNTGIILELLTDINMLLMFENGIRVGIFHAIHSCAETNKKYMKVYDKPKELSSPKNLDANNLYK